MPSRGLSLPQGDQRKHKSANNNVAETGVIIDQFAWDREHVDLSATYLLVISATGLARDLKWTIGLWC